MKQAEFIQKFSEKINQTQKDTKVIVDEFWALITKVIKSGDEVAFPEFGKFLVKKQPARTARNPITGASVKVPAKVAPKFRASKKLKEAVGGGAPKK